MRLEFLESGASDCPLIRIYGFEPGVCQGIKRAIEHLSEGLADEVSLSDFPGIESVDECQLVAKTGKWDRGVLQEERKRFQWVLTPATWDNVAGLIEPFCDGASGYQWLEQAGDIRVLLSADGSW